MPIQADCPGHANGGAARGARLARRLHRLLVLGRFGPLALWLLDGRRIVINDAGEVRLRRAAGTIEVTMRGDVQEILFEELLAIELRPRLRFPVVPRHDGPAT